jgi:UDP-N-acetylglucosamine transferase subunit ALG13
MAGRVFLVASTGGHLEELFKLHTGLLGPGDEPVWITFDTPQSRSLLAGAPAVHYLRRVGTRGYLDLLRVLWPAIALLLRGRPDRVYSTGAAVALAFLPFAWLTGASAVYVESAARTTGPSVTGRLLSLVPWIRLHTQTRSWAGRRWTYRGSVFDGYQPRPAGEPRAVRCVVVTLGTQQGYPFVSLVQRMRQIVPDGVEVRWQIGADFPEQHRPPGAREMISRAELDEWIRGADAVVTHAGVGSALTLLDCGKTPVLVPRSASRGEHVDEHQQLIAAELAGRGLGVLASADALTWNDVLLSTAMGAEPAVPAGQPPEPAVLAATPA